MTDVADLLQITRDSNISEADRQDVLRSLQHLADTGNQEAKNALETGLRIPYPHSKEASTNRPSLPFLTPAAKQAGASRHSIFGTDGGLFQGTFLKGWTPLPLAPCPHGP
jgi:hypothetical protein